MKLKSGDKLVLGRHAIAVHLPRGRGRVAVLTVPPELKGRVRVVKKLKASAHDQRMQERR